MKNTCTVVLLTLTAPTVALASPIYRWVDEQGVTNYTDSKSKIPPQYEAEITTGDELGMVAAEQEPSSAPSKSVREQDRATNLPNDEQDRAVEEQWRTLFQQAYARIRQLEAMIEQDRYSLEAEWPTHRRPWLPYLGWARWNRLDSSYLNRAQRILSNEAELKRAQDALDDLERLASREAIPREWRQP